MDCFPLDHLEGKTCILLNSAHACFPSLGPISFSNNLKFLKDCQHRIQIVKGRSVPPKDKKKHGHYATDNHCQWDDPARYVFSYRCNYQGDKWSHFDEKALWREPDYYWNVAGGSVAIFAVQFAVLAGAASITLVGCDCCSLGGADYAAEHDQRIGWRHDYRAYATGLEKLWEECRLKGIPLLNLTPFPGLGFHLEQYERFKAWQTTEAK